MEQYFLRGIALSTNIVYTAGVKLYLAHCKHLHTAPLSATQQLLCKFLTHLATSNMTYASIIVYLAAACQLYVCNYVSKCAKVASIRILNWSKSTLRYQRLINSERVLTPLQAMPSCGFLILDGCVW